MKQNSNGLPEGTKTPELPFASNPSAFHVRGRLVTHTFTRPETSPPVWIKRRACVFSEVMHENDSPKLNAQAVEVDAQPILLDTGRRELTYVFTEPLDRTQPQGFYIASDLYADENGRPGALFHTLSATQNYPRLDIHDYALVADGFSGHPGEPGCDENTDLKHDSTTDVMDFGLFVSNYGDEGTV